MPRKYPLRLPQPIIIVDIYAKKQQVNVITG